MQPDHPASDLLQACPDQVFNALCALHAQTLQPFVDLQQAMDSHGITLSGNMLTAEILPSNFLMTTSASSIRRIPFGRGTFVDAALCSDDTDILAFLQDVARQLGLPFDWQQLVSGENFWSAVQANKVNACKFLHEHRWRWPPAAPFMARDHTDEEFLPYGDTMLWLNMLKEVGWFGSPDQEFYTAFFAAVKLAENKHEWARHAESVMALLAPHLHRPNAIMDQGWFRESLWKCGLRNFQSNVIGHVYAAMLAHEAVPRSLSDMFGLSTVKDYEVNVAGQYELLPLYVEWLSGNATDSLSWAAAYMHEARVSKSGDTANIKLLFTEVVKSIAPSQRRVSHPLVVTCMNSSPVLNIPALLEVLHDEHVDIRGSFRATLWCFQPGDSKKSGSLFVFLSARLRGEFDSTPMLRVLQDMGGIPSLQDMCRSAAGEVVFIPGGPVPDLVSPLYILMYLLRHGPRSLALETWFRYLIQHGFLSAHCVIQGSELIHWAIATQARDAAAADPILALLIKCGARVSCSLRHVYGRGNERITPAWYRRWAAAGCFCSSERTPREDEVSSIRANYGEDIARRAAMVPDEHTALFPTRDVHVPDHVLEDYRFYAAAYAHLKRRGRQPRMAGRTLQANAGPTARNHQVFPFALVRRSIFDALSMFTNPGRIYAALPGQAHPDRLYELLDQQESLLIKIHAMMDAIANGAVRQFIQASQFLEMHGIRDVYKQKLFPLQLVHPGRERLATALDFALYLFPTRGRQALAVAEAGLPTNFVRSLDYLVWPQDSPVTSDAVAASRDGFEALMDMGWRFFNSPSITPTWVLNYDASFMNGYISPGLVAALIRARYFEDTKGIRALAMLSSLTGRVQFPDVVTLMAAVLPIRYPTTPAAQQEMDVLLRRMLQGSWDCGLTQIQAYLQATTQQHGAPVLFSQVFLPPDCLNDKFSLAGMIGYYSANNIETLSDIARNDQKALLLMIKAFHSFSNQYGFDTAVSTWWEAAQLDLEPWLGNACHAFQNGEFLRVWQHIAALGIPNNITFPVREERGVQVKHTLFSYFCTHATARIGLEDITLADFIIEGNDMLMDPTQQDFLLAAANASTMPHDVYPQLYAVLDLCETFILAGEIDLRMLLTEIGQRMHCQFHFIVKGTALLHWVCMREMHRPDFTPSSMADLCIGVFPVLLLHGARPMCAVEQWVHPPHLPPSDVQACQDIMRDLLIELNVEEPQWRTREEELQCIREEFGESIASHASSVPLEALPCQY